MTYTFHVLNKNEELMYYLTDVFHQDFQHLRIKTDLRGYMEPIFKKYRICIDK